MTYNTVTRDVPWIRRATVVMALAWLRQLVVDFSPLSLVYVASRMGFVEDEVSLIQVTVRLIRFFPVSIIPPTLQTHLHVHVSVTGRTSGRNLGTLNPFMEIGKRCVGKCCNFCCGFQRVEIFRAISYYVCVCMCVCVCVCVCVYRVFQEE